MPLDKCVLCFLVVDWCFPGTPCPLQWGPNVLGIQSRPGWDWLPSGVRVTSFSSTTVRLPRFHRRTGPRLLEVIRRFVDQVSRGKPNAARCWAAGTGPPSFFLGSRNEWSCWMLEIRNLNSGGLFLVACRVVPDHLLGSDQTESLAWCCFTVSQCCFFLSGEIVFWNATGDRSPMS
jgi:hypothetical protein